MPTASPPPRLETAQLVLRKPTLADADAIYDRYATDSEVVRFLVWQPHQAVADTRAFLQDCLHQWQAGANRPFVVAERAAPGTPIGMIDLRPEGHAVSFGYVLERPHWGRGYATEALAALVDWALAQPQFWRAWAFCDAENLASARVMEKAGMRFEGLLRRYAVSPNISPEPRDCRLYAKVKD